MRKRQALIALFGLALACGVVYAAAVVPSTIDEPGTQPGEVTNLQPLNRCDNCHAGYDAAVKPVFNWQGSMMANAGRDPIFWATLAVAEQDLNGSGDLCIRCHAMAGWIAERSTPTDGSGLVPDESFRNWLAKQGIDRGTWMKKFKPRYWAGWRNMICRRSASGGCGKSCPWLTRTRMPCSASRCPRESSCGSEGR